MFINEETAIGMKRGGHPRTRAGVNDRRNTARGHISPERHDERTVLSLFGTTRQAS